MKNDSFDAQESAENASACAQIEYDSAILSDGLYCLASQMTDMGLQGVDEFIKRQCDLNRLAFPPQQVSKRHTDRLPSVGIQL